MGFMNSSGTEKIAIVIPAYKADFLRQALSSIAMQTCRDFVVYVGDDCSRYDIKSAVSEFASGMEIRYVRFDENLGGRDLVGQWERCIRLVRDEKWIWLFSDDDMMPTDGVERIRKAIVANSQAQFFRLPLQVVDETGAVTLAHRPFSGLENTAEEYLLEYFRGMRPSSACEYVFRKDLFESLGMVHFPCAWCSDIATWYSYAMRSGTVVNVAGSPASWRNADGVNISSTNGLYDRKMEALIQFVAWLRQKHGLPMGKGLRSALRSYVETILSVSLDFHYTKNDLLRLVRELKPISPERAFKLYVKYFFKSKI